MTTRQPYRALRRVPPILVGAGLLAALSLVWSGYAITDLMHSGRFGLSVAVAGDIGWLTVLWAEYRGVTITIGKRTVDAAAAGLAIALGVAVLLGLHGHDAHSVGQTIAGPFVVLIGKAVWAYALASLRDPAALTPEQLAEIHSVMRDSEYTARLHHAQLDQLDQAADAEIARIRAEARMTLARDEADFEIALERLEKRAQIERRAPLALHGQPMLGPTPPAPITGEQIADQIASTANTPTNTPPEQTPNTPLDRANIDCEQPNSKPIIADVVRDQIASTANNADAVDAVMRIIPDANRGSVAAAVRRARSKNDMKDGYA